MEKRGFRILMSVGLLMVLVLPLVMAYNGFNWGYYPGPLQYLDNEWVMFSVLMLIFFGIIFYTINKAFDNNVVSGVIALALSLLITLTILRRGLLYGYAGDELGSWIMVAVILVAFGFLIKFSFEAFGVVGSTGTVIIIWFLLQRTDPYQFLPYGVSDVLITSYEFIASFFGLVILVAIAIFAAPFLERETTGQRMLKKIFRNFGFKR